MAPFFKTDYIIRPVRLQYDDSLPAWLMLVDDTGITRPLIDFCDRYGLLLLSVMTQDGQTFGVFEDSTLRQRHATPR